MFLFVLSLRVVSGLIRDLRKVALKAPLSMGFPKASWSGLPFPSPGDLPHPGTEPRSPALLTDALPSEPPGKSVSVYIF